MSGVKKAPDFEKKPTCQKCGTSFGLITRQHHCRNCGKSYCEKCSAKSLPIPAFGFVDPVRVCDPCFTAVQASAKSGPAPGRAPPPKDLVGRTESAKTGTSAPTPSSPTSSSSSSTTSTTSSSTSSTPPPSTSTTTPSTTKSSTRPRSASEDEAIRDVDPTPTPAPPKKVVSKCVCGLPFCICPADKVDEPKKEDKIEKKSKPTPTPVKKTETTTTSSSTFAHYGAKKGLAYDMKGDLNEQCRDAIKAGDFAGVSMLLTSGAKANFVDRTGNTLVHLAALFNHLNIVELLIKNGADVWAKNPANETAVDIAPPALAAKMRELQPPPTTSS